MHRSPFWRRQGSDSEDSSLSTAADLGSHGGETSPEPYEGPAGRGGAGVSLQSLAPNDGTFQYLKNANGKAAALTVAQTLAQRKGSTAFAEISTASGSFDSYHGPLSSVSSVDDYNKPLDFTDLAEEEAREAASSSGAVSSPYGKANYEVLRLEAAGSSRGFYVRRRDVLREHKLQPRDLRRIDPSVDFTKTSPSVTIKENVLLLNLGGVR